VNDATFRKVFLTLVFFFFKYSVLICFFLNEAILKHFNPFDSDTKEPFKDLFDSAHDLIHFADIDGGLLYVNKSWMKLLEYEEAEIKGRSIFSFVHENDVDNFKQYRQRIINGNIADAEIIITIISKSGSFIKLEGFVSVKVNDGKPIYTRGIFRDVTSKLENEAKLNSFYSELKERELNLTQLLIHAPDAIIVIDKVGKISFWNPKAENVFGWKFEEVLGKSLTETIIPQQYRQAHDYGMQRYLATGEVHVLNKTIEITALNKEGEEFYVSLTISTTSQHGNISFIAFIRDITLQKQNEKELVEKTSQLEKSNRNLEHFAHVASHDMKEPIRKVKVFSERLEAEFETLLPAAGKTYLYKVKEAANRLATMVDGVLNYSMISSNTEPFEIIDLTGVLKNIEVDLELMVKEKNATFYFNDLPNIKGVPFLIYQLFYNLINNSLKFSKGSVPLLINIKGQIKSAKELMIESVDENALFTVVQIQDNGIGFDQEFALKIFQSFTRLHPKHLYEGTGLGLALCKNIVDRHNGFIWASGSEGEGASFTVALPKEI
jgi:PAS domain S-box-containing protein